MKRITVIIERAENNFSAYIREVDGIAVTGDSIDAIKSSMIKAISEYVNMCKELNIEVPSEFSEGYELWHYAHGKSVPRPAQRRKIENALHRLGSELVSRSL